MAFSTGARIAFFIYFFTHVPATLLIDLQAILPPEWFPQPVRDLLQVCTGKKGAESIQKPLTHLPTTSTYCITINMLCYDVCTNATIRCRVLG